MKTQLHNEPEHVSATSEENWLHSNTSPKLLRCNISRSDVTAAEPARGQRGIGGPAPQVEALKIDIYGHLKCLHFYVSRNCVNTPPALRNCLVMVFWVLEFKGIGAWKFLE